MFNMILINTSSAWIKSNMNTGSYQEQLFYAHGRVRAGHSMDFSLPKGIIMKLM